MVSVLARRVRSNRSRVLVIYFKEFEQAARGEQAVPFYAIQSLRRSEVVETRMFCRKVLR